MRPRDLDVLDALPPRGIGVRRAPIIKLILKTVLAQRADSRSKICVLPSALLEAAMREVVEWHLLSAECSIRSTLACWPRPSPAASDYTSELAVQLAA